MYFEAVFSFYVLLYHFVGHSFFGLIAFRSFSNIIKRNFSLTLAKLDPSRRVTLADVNLRALECCKSNAISLGVEGQVEILQSDVYSNIAASFSTIVTNPPIRAGKKVTYAMYAGAVSHLNEGGSLILVIRKAQGAPSCQRYLETLFPSVSVVAQHKGYRILIAKK